MEDNNVNCQSRNRLNSYAEVPQPNQTVNEIPEENGVHFIESSGNSENGIAMMVNKVVGWLQTFQGKPKKILAKRRRFSKKAANLTNPASMECVTPASKLETPKQLDLRIQIEGVIIPPLVSIWKHPSAKTNPENSHTDIKIIKPVIDFGTTPLKRRRGTKSMPVGVKLIETSLTTELSSTNDAEDKSMHGKHGKSANTLAIPEQPSSSGCQKTGIFRKRGRNPSPVPIHATNKDKQNDTTLKFEVDGLAPLPTYCFNEVVDSQPNGPIDHEERPIRMMKTFIEQQNDNVNSQLDMNNNELNKKTKRLKFDNPQKPPRRFFEGPANVRKSIRHEELSVRKQVGLTRWTKMPCLNGVYLCSKCNHHFVHRCLYLRHICGRLIAPAKELWSPVRKRVKFTATTTTMARPPWR